MRTRLYGVGTCLFVVLALLSLAIWPRSYSHCDGWNWAWRATAIGVSSHQGHIYLGRTGVRGAILRGSYSSPALAGAESMSDDWLDSLGNRANTSVNIRGGGFRLLAYADIGCTAFCLVIPHWFAALSAGALAVLCFRRYRACRRSDRVRSGRCARCAYDLTGNTSGRCPECGEEIKSTNQARREDKRAAVA